MRDGTNKFLPIFKGPASSHSLRLSQTQTHLMWKMVSNQLGLIRNATGQFVIVTQPIQAKLCINYSGGRNWASGLAYSLHTLWFLRALTHRERWPFGLQYLKVEVHGWDWATNLLIDGTNILPPEPKLVPVILKWASRQNKSSNSL